MCGRYSVFYTWAEVHAFSQPLSLFTPAGDPEPRYNLAPTDRGWVIRPDEVHGFAAHRMRWGLIPSWAKTSRPGVSTFNARIETAAARPAFRNAWRGRRCVVPASGYYEWRLQPDRRTRIPHMIRNRDATVLMFAGLWERWNSADGAVDSYSIVTCDAEGELASLHDRRPVMLPPELLRDWMCAPADEAADIAASAPEPHLAWYAVGTAVGNVRNQGPRLIEPVQV